VCRVVRVVQKSRLGDQRTDRSKSHNRSAPLQSITSEQKNTYHQFEAILFPPSFFLTGATTNSGPGPIIRARRAGTRKEQPKKTPYQNRQQSSSMMDRSMYHHHHARAIARIYMLPPTRTTNPSSSGWKDRLTVAIVSPIKKRRLSRLQWPNG
jgi:hypothetical protein